MDKWESKFDVKMPKVKVIGNENIKLVFRAYLPDNPRRLIHVVEYISLPKTRSFSDICLSVSRSIVIGTP